MAEEIWQDRDVRFDVNAPEMKERAGERILSRVDAIEDTKGNSGIKGRVIVTNLRVIWFDTNMPCVNLSIGLNCIINMSVKKVTSRMRGETEALYMLTKVHNSRFEFIFTSLLTNAPRQFNAILAIHKLYEESRLYRDMKIRGALLQNKELKLLPLEEISNVINGVWNLSSDQGNLGTFAVTNVRLVWYSNMNENFNVSLPYLQIKGVKVRESKFGTALVVETQPKAGNLVLGFRIDPADKLVSTGREISKLHQTYARVPIFGVSYISGARGSGEAGLGEEKLPTFSEDLEIDVTSAQRDIIASYYSDGGPKRDGPPEIEFCEELGLAIEKLPPGVTIKDLWKIDV